MVDSPLGKIPEGWEVKAFSYFANFVNGYAFKPTDWGTVGFPIIKIKERKEGVTAQTPRYGNDDLPLKYRINNGDVLFSWSADLDVYYWSGGEGWLNQHLFNVCPKIEMSKLFIFYALKDRPLTKCLAYYPQIKYAISLIFMFPPCLVKYKTFKTKIETSAKPMTYYSPNSSPANWTCQNWTSLSPRPTHDSERRLFIF